MVACAGVVVCTGGVDKQGVEECVVCCISTSREVSVCTGQFTSSPVHLWLSRFFVL